MTDGFKDLELAGWERRAASYDERFGAITAETIPPLLQAVAARPGMRVLDLCTGTGTLAGAAAARGLVATGVDFAPSMVALATRRWPGAHFEVGDIEDLRFAAASFEAVTCAFGLLHVARPEHVFAHAARVLRPGGRFAFTVWCDPSLSKFHALVIDAIAAHGGRAAPLPPAPSPFRFSDHAQCRHTLQAHGFTDIDVGVLPLVLDIDPAALLAFVLEGTVRLAMLLEAQPPDARGAIERAIVQNAQQYRAGGRLVIPVPAVLASGRKPEVTIA